MKKNSIFQTVFFTVLMFVFTAAAAASELRVSQLGSAWLVPDEYMDVIVNPAMVNSIGKAILSGTLDNFVFKNNHPDANDLTAWSISPQIANMSTYGDVGGGLIYRAPYTLNKVDTVETSHSLGNELTVIFGKKFDKELSLGISANFQTLYKDNETPNLTSLGEIKLGADYDMGDINLGAVLSASSEFIGSDNANFSVKLLSGIKDAGGSEIRVMNETIYDSYKIEPELTGTDSPFGDKTFGSYSVDNNTSVSYINSYNSIRYIIGLQHNWTIVNQTNTGSALPFSTTTQEVTEEKEDVFIQMGFEAKVITDWLILRGSYIPFRYTHNYSHLMKTIDSVEDERRNDDDSIALLSTDYLTIGLGVILGKDMILDVLVNGPRVLSYNRSSNSMYDTWNESGYSLLVVEYTVRF